jgi:hypothetical protein
LQNVNGCDSIIHLYLEVTTIPVPTNLIITQIDKRFDITWQGGAELYKLYRNNTLLATLDTTTFYLDTNLIEGTNYCYTIKAMDGDCESELSEEICLTFNHTGIEERQTTKFNVYPNPTNGQLTITNYGLQDEDDYTIYNVMGQVMMQGKLTGEISIINIESLPSGIYYLKISSEKNKAIKIIKNN